MISRAWPTIIVLALSVCAAAAQTDIEAIAQVAKLKPAGFPSRTVEVIVANAAGGGMDVNGRLFAKYFEKYLGQSTVVNNRVGAGGFVGHTWLATQAPNDGSVVGYLGSSILADSMLRAAGKWNYMDIEPLVFVNYEPVIWLTSTSGAYKDKSLREIADIAKDKPETVRVAIAANSFFEMLAEQVELLTGAKFIKVPFGGDQPARTALLGNHIDVSLGFAGSAKGDIESGLVKMIGVAAETRLPDFKDVPTFNESLGSKSIVWVSWRYLAAPKGMSNADKKFLTAAAQAAVRDPGLIADYRKIGAIMDPRLATPEATLAELDRLASIEREFYLRSGRMK